MVDMVKRTHSICITEESYNMMIPLLQSLPFVEKVAPHKDEVVTINLDEIMDKEWLNIPYGYIPRWWFYLYPDMACDLSKRWLDLSKRDDMRPKIILNRSSRYHNPTINYGFLKKHIDSILFVGLDDEWKSFCRSHLEVPHYKPKDFLELAIAINSCKLFIGNQSFCYSLAEAVKAPRILELFSPLPNVVPNGPNGYDFYHQGALEYYVNEILK